MNEGSAVWPLLVFGAVMTVFAIGIFVFIIVQANREERELKDGK
jgi:protein-S-isoprenylcysteine O-methyltransferase Ste14